MHLNESLRSIEVLDVCLVRWWDDERSCIFGNAIRKLLSRDNSLYNLRSKHAVFLKFKDESPGVIIAQTYWSGYLSRHLTILCSIKTSRIKMNNTPKFIIVCLVYYHYYWFYSNWWYPFCDDYDWWTNCRWFTPHFLTTQWSGMYMVTINSFILSPLYSTHAIRRENLHC